MTLSYCFAVVGDILFFVYLYREGIEKLFIYCSQICFETIWVAGIKRMISEK